MDSQWLKAQFRSNPHKTKAGLAQALGLEPPAISKIIAGTRQIKAQEYILMRKYFGLPTDGENSVSKNPGGKKAFSLSESSALPPEWLIPSSILPQEIKEGQEKTRIFQVPDDFMAPEFEKGSYVLVDVADRKPLPAGLFIVSDGYSNMLRHCEYVPDKTPFEIKISAKKNFQAQILRQEDFIILGRVIARVNML